MKVSFLVTYYNQVQYVEESLSSILNIDKPCDWEIIVGDDGSTDGTIEKVKEFIRRYPGNIFLYVMPRELNRDYDSVRRASANRLNVLEHATGELFCILDGDDFYCDKDFIKDAVKIFEEYEDVSVVSFGFKYYQGGVFGEEKVLSDEDSSYIDKKLYLKSYYVHAGACVYKIKWDEDRIRYIKEIGYFDDNDIVINSLQYGEMYALNKVIYAYRQTSISVYNGMDSVEQAVLNVLGLDVDIKLIDKEFRDVLIERNASAIIEMFIWRKKMRKRLGEEKYNRYLVNCMELDDSFAYKILYFADIQQAERVKMQKLMKIVIRKYKGLFIKLKLKYLFGGFIK